MKNAQAKPNVRRRKRLPHNVDLEYKGDNFDDPPDELWTPKQYFDKFFLTNHSTNTLLNKLIFIHYK